MTADPTQDYGRLKLFVSNAWVDSSSEDVHDVYNPATGRPLGKVPYATGEEVDRAVLAAQEAFEKWRSLSIPERVKHLFKLKDVMEMHFEEIAAANTINHGKTLEESRGDIRRSIENIETAVAAALTLAKGDVLQQVAGGVDTEMTKEPLGVFAVVCPFNFPVMIPFWFIPYALVLGDTVVLKPSEITPVPMQLTTRLLQEEAGLPPGVLNIVHGGKEVVGELVAHGDVKGVTFVGSTPVAKEVYRLAGQHGKRVIANGGAKNNIVVMPDADVERFLPSIISSFFGNTGQRCLAGANLLSVGPNQEPLLRKFSAAAARLKIGYGMEDGVEMGPLVSDRAKQRVGGFVEAAVGEGAKLVADGRGTKVPEHPEGFYFGATVLDEVTPEMGISKAEVFGPVANVIRRETLDEAIETVNTGTNFGNMACIYTSSGAAAREFKTRAEAGNIGINLGVAAPVGWFPFGGRRDSFFGILHPQVDTIGFFTDKKITISRW